MTREEIIKEFEALYSDLYGEFEDNAEKATLAPEIERERYECYAKAYKKASDALLDTIRDVKKWSETENN